MCESHQEKKFSSYKVFYDGDEWEIWPYAPIDSKAKLTELIEEIVEEEGDNFSHPLLEIYGKVDFLIDIKRTVDVALKLV